MGIKIENEYDYLVAKAEAETNKAREILLEARERNDYYQEKVAAKLLEFCETQEKSVRLYAEARLYYPDLGDLIEKRWPQYRSLSDEARLKLGELEHGQ
ncbi:MAG TPA: hypothetical protein VHF05_02485 [Candidatus Paceibacterota bacterium]|jgi:hypothetical protein|nr:hypothetical protein [Candidatus Paceibacterota bacterium]